MSLRCRCAVSAGFVWRWDLRFFVLAVLGLAGLALANTRLQTNDIRGDYVLSSCENGDCPAAVTINKAYNVVEIEGEQYGNADSREFPGFGCQGVSDLLMGVRNVTDDDIPEGYVQGAPSPKNPPLLEVAPLNCVKWSRINFTTTDAQVANLGLQAQGSLSWVQGTYQKIDYTPCFASSTQVLVRRPNGEETQIRMDEVRVGDEIASIEKDKKKTFSRVFLTQHFSKALVAAVLAIEVHTDQGTKRTLRVTSKHLVTDCGERWIPAGNVHIGDRLLAMEPDSIAATCATVTGVSLEANTVVNVHTMNDLLIANGVVATSYNALANLMVLKALTFPMKLLFMLSGRNAPEKLYYACAPVLEWLNMRVGTALGRTG